jgi:hypothetical protein
MIPAITPRDVYDLFYKFLCRVHRTCPRQGLDGLVFDSGRGMAWFSLLRGDSADT